MRFMTIGSYYFAHIYLKNGEDLILTSLLSPRIKASLRKLKGVCFDKDVSNVASDIVNILESVLGDP